MPNSAQFLCQKEWPVGCLFVSCCETDPHDLLGCSSWKLQATGKLVISDDAVEVWAWRRVA